MKLRFEIVPGVDLVPGRPDYTDGDYAFHYVLESEELANEIEGSQGVVSLAVDTLEMVVSREKQLVLWVHGYWPYHSWRRHALRTPDASRGGLHVRLPRDSGHGMTYRVDVRSWVTHFDPHTGWVLISGRWPMGTTSAVEFAVDTVAAIDDGNLDALWIRPGNWTDLVPKIG